MKMLFGLCTLVSDACLESSKIANFGKERLRYKVENGRGGWDGWLISCLLNAISLTNLISSEVNVLVVCVSVNVCVYVCVCVRLAEAQLIGIT